MTYLFIPYSMCTLVYKSHRTQSLSNSWSFILQSLFSCSQLLTVKGRLLEVDLRTFSVLLLRELKMSSMGTPRRVFILFVHQKKTYPSLQASQFLLEELSLFFSMNSWTTLQDFLSQDNAIITLQAKRCVYK